MSTHTSLLTWPAPGDAVRPFTYESYSRDHLLTWGTGESIRTSAAPEFRGNPALANPEELFVGALSSCHMLTFLAIAARKGMVVTSYTDNAAGTLAKDERGVLCITGVVLHPVVTFAEPVDAQTLAHLHESAHKGCFIANSVRMPVTVEG